MIGSGRGSADVVKKQYQHRHDDLLVPLAAELERYLKKLCADIPHVDRIGARAKGVDRFIEKAAKRDKKGKPKYSDPLNQIQDQVGARITVLYLSDLDTVTREVERYFRHIERKSIVPDSEKEFGYIGKHYILFLPRDLSLCARATKLGVTFFELQVKTVFQHAWSEAEHDVGYKPMQEVTPDQKRMIAFTAAQAWGADQMFAQLQRELSQS
jgi:ppGpp synthetase/RelA/SpoT-type nucleotidyltranferase